MASRFVRRVRTASGAVAVQIVVKDRGQVVEVDHMGSAHTDAELELLLEVARERLRPGQGMLDLGPLPRIQASTRMSPTVPRPGRCRSPVLVAAHGSWPEVGAWWRPLRCCSGTS
jgi:hypothetical protein